uniref:Sm domain-containing protein n=1 Tax=Varanus komodoensis TaxID=61221 RepID=A0A8D2L9Y3_VARKO
NQNCQEIKATFSICISDGQIIVRTLKGVDQTSNLFLDESHERVLRSSQGVEQVVIGMHIVTGDTIAVFREIDAFDSAIDQGNIRRMGRHKNVLINK